MLTKNAKMESPKVLSLERELPLDHMLNLNSYLGFSSPRRGALSHCLFLLQLSGKTCGSTHSHTLTECLVKSCLLQKLEITPSRASWHPPSLAESWNVPSPNFRQSLLTQQRDLQQGGAALSLGITNQNN